MCTKAHWRQIEIDIGMQNAVRVFIVVIIARGRRDPKESVNQKLIINKR